jgi:hypothetical protein
MRLRVCVSVENDAKFMNFSSSVIVLSVQNNPPGKDLSVSDCEHIVVTLLVNGLIQVNVQWTSYE